MFAFQGQITGGKLWKLCRAAGPILILSRVDSEINSECMIKLSFWLLEIHCCTDWNFAVFRSPGI